MSTPTSMATDEATEGTDSTPELSSMTLQLLASDNWFSLNDAADLGLHVQAVRRVRLIPLNCNEMRSFNLLWVTTPPGWNLELYQPGTKCYYLRDRAGKRQLLLILGGLYWFRTVTIAHSRRIRSTAPAVVDF